MAARCAVIFWPISATAYRTVAHASLADTNREPQVFQPGRGGCRTPEVRIVTPTARLASVSRLSSLKLPSAMPLRIPQAPLASPQDEPVSSPASLGRGNGAECMRGQGGV